MLHQIRKIVYAMGMRPKQGSIFFSPTIAVTLANHEAWRSMVEVMKKVEATGSMINLFEIPPPPVVKIDSRQTLYEQMLYCVLCRAKLESLVLDIKECPHGCGRVFTTENAQGLPVITFEPLERNTP
jgi:hypothetical protein